MVSHDTRYERRFRKMHTYFYFVLTSKNNKLCIWWKFVLMFWARDKLLPRFDVKGFQNSEEFWEVWGGSWGFWVIITGVTITWCDRGYWALIRWTAWSDYGWADYDEQKYTNIRDLWHVRKDDNDKLCHRALTVSPPPIMGYVTPITKYGFLDNKLFLAQEWQVTRYPVWLFRSGHRSWNIVVTWVKTVSI